MNKARKANPNSHEMDDARRKWDLLHRAIEVADKKEEATHQASKSRRTKVIL